VLSGGIAYGEGRGFIDAKGFLSPYLAAGARGGMELIRAGPYSGSVYVELTTPILYTNLTTSGVEVWSMPRIAGTVGLAVVGSIL
jgi:hypothetical protein